MLRKAMHIILDVAISKGLTVEQLLGGGRSKTLAAARKLAVRRVRKETTLSTPEMGRLFKYKDHTTILHHLKN